LEIQESWEEMVNLEFQVMLEGLDPLDRRGPKDFQDHQEHVDVKENQVIVDQWDHQDCQEKKD